MCGLVAVLGDQDKSSRELFKDMLYADVVRGPHSTGVVAIQKDGFDTWKKAMPSYDFLELAYTHDIIDTATTGLIGHNRWATLGAKTSQNAHPFVHGDVALVHNGTLTNKTRLSSGLTYDTDSEVVAYNLSQKENIAEIKDFIESLEGAYALIWADVYNKVHIAKNDERTLFWYTVKRGKARNLVLSSERGLAEWLLERNGYEVKESGPVPVGKILSLELSTLAHEVTEFKPAEKKKIKTFPSYGRQTYGTAAKYTYPQGNKQITFIIDSVGDSYFDGTTVGEYSEYDVRVYKHIANDVKVGDIYTGYVQSFRDDGVYFIRPNSIKKLYDQSQTKQSHILCGWCNTEISNEALEKQDFVMMGSELMHTECDECFMAGLSD